MAQAVSHRPFTHVGLGSFPGLCVYVCVGGGGSVVYKVEQGGV
jgi:hypothetical protein